MLKGQAKKDYQRRYMKEYRAKLRSNSALLDPSRWCEACGESRVVESHHIDKSHDNQASNNLIDLCPTCHKVLHKEGLTINELLYKSPDIFPELDPRRPRLDIGRDGMIIATPFPNYEVDADGNPVYEEG